MERSERIDLAEAFLREAVYRSRDRQALQTALASKGASPAEGPGNCGLGEKAAIVLELSDRGRELFGGLWPEGLVEPKLESVRELQSAWIREQDGFDRKRNHFLKAFRKEHGFDRTAYSPEQLASYDDGLAEINGEVNERQREVATRLVDLG